MFTGTPIPTLEKQYEGKGYGDLKGDLAQVWADFVTPLQAQVAVYLADPGNWTEYWRPAPSGRGEVADATVAAVYDKVGLLGG